MGSYFILARLVQRNSPNKLVIFLIGSFLTISKHVKMVYRLRLQLGVGTIFAYFLLISLWKPRREGFSYLNIRNNSNSKRGSRADLCKRWGLLLLLDSGNRHLICLCLIFFFISFPPPLCSKTLPFYSNSNREVTRML